MSAPSFVSAQGYRLTPRDPVDHDKGIIAVPTTPMNWGAVLFFSYDNASGQDYDWVEYRTALHSVPMDKLLRFENTNRVLSVWIANLRWWETDEDGYVEFKWNTSVPSQFAYMVLENVRYSDPLRATDTLINAGNSTIAMDTADGLVLSMIKVTGGAQDYNPTNGGVERYDTVDEGGNSSFAIATDDTESSGSNTWGWTHSGTGRDNIAAAVSLWGSESPEPRELRQSRRGRHSVVVPTGFQI